MQDPRIAQYLWRASKGSFRILESQVRVKGRILSIDELQVLKTAIETAINNCDEEADNYTVKSTGKDARGDGKSVKEERSLGKPGGSKPSPRRERAESTVGSRVGLYSEAEDRALRKAFKPPIASKALLRQIVRKLTLRLGRTVGSVRTRARKLGVFPLELGKYGFKHKQKNSKSSHVTSKVLPGPAALDGEAPESESGSASGSESTSESESSDTTGSAEGSSHPSEGLNNRQMLEENRENAARSRRAKLYTAEEEEYIRTKYARLLSAGVRIPEAINHIAVKLRRSYTAVEKRLRFKCHFIIPHRFKYGDKAGEEGGVDGSGSGGNCNGNGGGGSLSDKDSDSSSILLSRADSEEKDGLGDSSGKRAQGSRPTPLPLATLASARQQRSLHREFTQQQQQRRPSTSASDEKEAELEFEETGTACDSGSTSSNNSASHPSQHHERQQRQHQHQRQQHQSVPSQEVNVEPGAFTAEEDALLWNAYMFNSDNPTTAPGSFGFRTGYLAELSELLGRHMNAVSRRLRDLKAERRRLEARG